MLVSEKSIVSLALLALFFKLLISPWSTGDFQTPTFQLFNYVCDGMILASIILYIPFQYKIFSFIYIVTILLLFTLLFSTFVLTENTIFNVITMHLKIYQPLLFFTMLATYFSKNQLFAVKLSKNIAIYTAFLLVIGVLTLPVSINRTEVWWPSYFGGLHTTAYMAMSVFFIAFSLFLLNLIKGKVLLAVGLTVLYCVFFGWGVRTITGAFIILVGAYYLQKTRFNEVEILKITLPALLFIGAVLFVFIIDSSDFDRFTSGRISMYAEKVDQLERNSIFSWIVGNGVGSDLITTDIWWWAAKGAHSDLITILVEGGVLYLGMTLLIFIKLFNLLKHSHARFLLLAFLFTSAFSNGYLVRPLPSYLFFVALALSYSYQYRGGNNER